MSVYTLLYVQLYRHDTLISIDAAFSSDLTWWSTVYQLWRCNSPTSLSLPSNIHYYGCIRFTGVWHLVFSWLVPEMIIVSILIILACAAWGSTGHTSQVLCYRNNRIIVSCLHLRTGKHLLLMVLLMLFLSTGTRV